MNLKKQAFTLVELIVVITIIAILGTIAFISLQGYSANSRDSVRISDTGNMKIALELFHLNSSKYPLPDNYSTAQYSLNNLFYQGTFGANVVHSVSRSMSKVPTDPLTNLEYIYSVSNTKNELEILSLLEGDDYALNITTQTNAAGIKVIPKINGNYNGVFIKTSSYIVPLPSIINTETNPNTVFTIDGNTIKSMVVDLGDNIPKYGNIISNTGALVNLKLSVYTGSINTKSSTGKILSVYNTIIGAYTGSSLINKGIISDFLSKTTNTEKISIVNSVVLNNKSLVTTTKVVISKDCTAGTIQGTTYNTITYGYNELIDTNLTSVIGTQVIINGNKNYTAIITCNNTVTTLSSEVETVVCDSGFNDTAVAGSCVADIVIDNTSCKTILNTGGSIGDGVYSIDPDGTGPITPFNAYCDMSNNGGGWTLVMASNTNMAGWGNNNFPSLSTKYTTNEVRYGIHNAKMETSIINSLLAQKEILFINGSNWSLWQDPSKDWNGFIVTPNSTVSKITNSLGDTYNNYNINIANSYCTYSWGNGPGAFFHYCRDWGGGSVCGNTWGNNSNPNKCGVLVR